MNNIEGLLSVTRVYASEIFFLRKCQASYWPFVYRDMKCAPPSCIQGLWFDICFFFFSLPAKGLCFLASFTGWSHSIKTPLPILPRANQLTVSFLSFSKVFYLFNTRVVTCKEVWCVYVYTSYLLRRWIIEYQYFPI